MSPRWSDVWRIIVLLLVKKRRGVDAILELLWYSLLFGELLWYSLVEMFSFFSSCITTVWCNSIIQSIFLRSSCWMNVLTLKYFCVERKQITNPWMILDVPLYSSLLNSPKQKILGKNPSRVSIDRLGSGTLTDTNIATEDQRLEDKISFWDGPFSGAMLVLGRVTISWLNIQHLYFQFMLKGSGSKLFPTSTPEIFQPILKEENQLPSSSIFEVPR